MPRTTLQVEPVVEYLSILDEHGRVDDALDPKLDGDLLVRMYRNMLATRRLDERLINMQRQGRLGTYGPSRGQEASQTGTAFALQPDDWTAQAFREMGMALARGWPMWLIMLFWGGHEEGNIVDEAIHDLPIAVPVASQLLHGVGIAWGMQLKQRATACMTYCGDGATSEGDFHEALNLAGVFTLPVVFVVQNNQFAISHPRSQQTRARTLAQKALAYGFNGIQVDGNDVLAVYVAASEALAKARSGGGPTLMECVTYRLIMHTTADDPTKYRDAEEVRQWEQREPLLRFTKYLQERGLLDDRLRGEIEDEICLEIRQAVERYTSFGGTDPLDGFQHMFAEMPAELAAQRAEFEAALRAEGWDQLR